MKRLVHILIIGASVLGLNILAAATGYDGYEFVSLGVTFLVGAVAAKFLNRRTAYSGLVPGVIATAGFIEVGTGSGMALFVLLGGLVGSLLGVMIGSALNPGTPLADAQAPAGVVDTR